MSSMCQTGNTNMSFVIPVNKRTWWWWWWWWRLRMDSEQDMDVVSVDHWLSRCRRWQKFWYCRQTLWDETCQIGLLLSLVRSYPNSSSSSSSSNSNSNTKLLLPLPLPPPPPPLLLLLLLLLERVVDLFELAVCFLS